MFNFYKQFNYIHHVSKLLFANRPFHPPAPQNRRRPIPPSGMGWGGWVFGIGASSWTVHAGAYKVIPGEAQDGNPRWRIQKGPAYQK